MNLLSLYHFFAGKASDKQKEAIKRWAESSPDNYETLCREKQWKYGLSIGEASVVWHQS